MATKTVKAWSTSEFGLASQVIKLGEIQLPGTLGPKEVLLKVKAAALNPVDVYIVSGNFQNGEGVKFPVNFVTVHFPLKTLFNFEQSVCSRFGLFWSC